MCLGIILSCQTCKNEMVIFNKTPCFKEKKKAYAKTQQYKKSQLYPDMSKNHITHICAVCFFF